MQLLDTSGKTICKTANANIDGNFRTEIEIPVSNLEACQHPISRFDIQRHLSVTFFYIRHFFFTVTNLYAGNF